LSFAELATLLPLFDARGLDLLLCLARPLDRDAVFFAPDGFPFVRLDELLRRAEPELADLRPPLAFAWGISPLLPLFALPPGGGNTHLAG
jgi:hypothetical protein